MDRWGIYSLSRKGSFRGSGTVYSTPSILLVSGLHGKRDVREVRERGGGVGRGGRMEVVPGRWVRSRAVPSSFSVGFRSCSLSVGSASALWVSVCR